MTKLIHSLMDVESCNSYVDNLYDVDSAKCLDAVIYIKNMIIGSNKAKNMIIQQGITPRLIQLLDDPIGGDDLKLEVIAVIGSLARGDENHIKSLTAAGVIPFLLNNVCASTNPQVIEFALRALQQLFQNEATKTDLLFADPRLVPQLLKLMPLSVCNQISVTSIFTNACKTAEHQAILCANGAVPALAALLNSPVGDVQLAALDAIASLCYQNQRVSALLTVSSFGGKSVTDHLVTLMARDRPVAMQLVAARCLTYLHRAGAISADDGKILYKTLPCLVRMCRKENRRTEKALGAETLAYLIEVDTELQRVASISDHLIQNLSLFLTKSREIPAVQLRGVESFDIEAPSAKEVQNLKQAALRAFASLGANDEDIRKRIIETDQLMDHVVTGLAECDDHRVQLAAVRCLHSLSRSVQQLRTTFQDHSVWKPLMKLLQNADEDILAVASSTLCNLLLEFSPSKEPILESGAVELLCNLTRREDSALRLNGIWALMNMAFQAEQKIKIQILSSLGTDQVFRLLSDHEVGVVMKTLGLLRNLLSTKPHIDLIMAQHGRQIMQAVILILEGEHSPDVKEQALCILANIADGETAKEFIMSNEDVLRKLTNYMSHSNVKLQTAATFCIGNLAWNEDSGCLERQARLRELGVYRILQQLLCTNDATLFEKVKAALQQFS
ncbi:armadillo repeat-containing protein 8 isoform X2 [Daphnia magna]|uniref:Armadillo repeat-containing protein 8 n=1 Tax=Daphnia magna TaxID=35525 RepID=A0ABQ9ZIH3_9CRUS|nr:armadillo repeat-containing protein 8 isoform X2 [Daphnia magna]KAK4012721.1 hypothetical protein OUZ56_024957 [Daphnia magna]